MSHVTDIILITALHDDTVPGYEAFGPLEIRLLNTWLTQSKGFPCRLNKVDAQFPGGNKYMQCEVYLGAFDTLDYEGFQKAFHAVDWYDPDGVQLFLKDEHEDLFTVIVPGAPLHVPLGRD